MIVIGILFGGSPFVRAQNAYENLKRNSVMQDPVFPNIETSLHNIGNIEVAITNYGQFVSSHADVVDNIIYRKHCVHPKGSYLNYMEIGEIWIGGVIGRDTLVSAGGYRGSDELIEIIGELYPAVGEEGRIIYRSILTGSPYSHSMAVSEQDFICHYCDTATDYAYMPDDALDGRGHKPLNICIRQSSYAWSFEYAEDFVLFDYYVYNVGDKMINDMFIGLYTDGLPFYGINDDYIIGNNVIGGFKRDIALPQGHCRDMDTLNISWLADYWGRPDEYGQWFHKSLRSVIGIQMLRPRFDETLYNFNWWSRLYGPGAYNWGPRKTPTNDDPYRDIGLGLGMPVGDRNRYYILSHPEFDYDQLFTAVSHTDDGFMPPPAGNVAENIADGWQVSQVLSFGPFDLPPGDSIPFSFALIAGENFHVNPRDYENYFNPYRPEIYYGKLDFSDLAQNSRWARAVFDNPGVDTDGDGYRGEFCWNYTWRDTSAADPSDSFVIDSFRNYYTGDSIPDFRAMAPPPPPEVRVFSDYGKAILRWNGQESETTPDYFSGKVDFEGYRVYYGQGDRLTDFVLLASYDIDDYMVFEFDTEGRLWKKISNSVKHDSLKQRHGPEFDADDYYDEYHYFLDPHTGNILYFVRQDWNQSDLSNRLGIHKVYPDASVHDPTDITEEGWRRFYEYEYVIDNLEPSVPYYFAVTAFDYGSFKYDMGQLETSPLTNAVREYPMPSADTVEHRGLNVIVYPNPYRIDGGYARAGYENRDRTKSAVWSRRIHFANLPNICTIRIYSIDGDLIREIKHYNPEGGPESQHAEWNVVSRNTQAVVTGIYLWHVRSEMGDQIGKLVIIK